ncbi:MAG: hypothetical protein QG650_954 [Patescibacteria group bacterium]|nr:hypothetical protein [Patescibacteria group bacterium]
MTPFILTEGLVPEKVQNDFRTARGFLADIPEATEKYPDAYRRRIPGKKPDEADAHSYHWSCHGIARALETVLKLPWRAFDGWFMGRGNEHAWLFLEYEGGKFILDAYPIAAVGGPILVDAGFMSPWLSAYEERRMHYAVKEIESFKRQGIQILEAYHTAFPMARL